MNLDEMKEQIEADQREQKNDSAQHLVIFMQFLRLQAGHTIAGVEFLPLRDPEGKVSAQLAGAEKALMKILSGYIDRHGKPFDNCVVATIPGRGWDLARADAPTVMWAASLLFTVQLGAVWMASAAASATL